MDLEAEIETEQREVLELFGQQPPKSPDKPTLTEFAPKVRFASDSPLEEAGLELPVPPRESRPITGTPQRSIVILAARGKVGVSGTESLQTLRWSKRDSKSRSRRERNGRGSGSRSHHVSREDLIDTGLSCRSGISFGSTRRTLSEEWD
jgi:hypothetical protein